jgi:uncharacterized protein YigE (DUF2233 family)
MTTIVPGGRIAAVAFLLAFAPVQAAADPCRGETFEETTYTVCSFDPSKADMRLFWQKAEGVPFKTFDALQEDLSGRGLTLRFAINGGMYGEDFAPTGLLIENGRELSKANTATVSGEPASVPNFYKKPNGVFYVSGEEAGVMETDAFLNVRPETQFATQSGPMLVIDNEIHPAFIVGSTDRKMRDGVGVCGEGEVSFAITEEPVNFYDFARFFRDHLGCENALFLDGGSAPGLYAPELRRDDPPGHGGYGPIIGVVEAAG